MISVLKNIIKACLILLPVPFSYAERTISYENGVEITNHTYGSYTSNCPSGWNKEDPLITFSSPKGKRVQVDIFLRNESQPSHQVSMAVPYRHPPVDRIYLNDLTYESAFISKSGIIDSSPRLIHHGFYIASGNLVPVVNDYRFCLFFKLFDYPEFVPGALRATQEFYVPLQSRYSYNGEVLVRKGKETTIDLGDDYIASIKVLDE